MCLRHSDTRPPSLSNKSRYMGSVGVCESSLGSLTCSWAEMPPTRSGSSLWSIKPHCPYVSIQTGGQDQYGNGKSLHLNAANS